MSETEAAYQRSTAAHQQAVEQETQAIVAYVQAPSDATAHALHVAMQASVLAHMVMNDCQKERLISAATLAQMAHIVGEALDQKVQVLEEGHVRNHDLLLSIMQHLGITQDVTVS
jgi:hypothetical protein